MSDPLQQVGRVGEVGASPSAPATAPAAATGAALERLSGGASPVERTAILRQSAAPLHLVVSSLLGQFATLYWDRNIAQQSEELLARPDEARRQTLARDYAVARRLGLSAATDALAKKALSSRLDQPQGRPTAAAAQARTLRQSGTPATSTGAVVEARVQSPKNQHRQRP